MATNSAACTILGQSGFSASSYSEAGWSAYGTDAQYAGKTYTNSNGTRYYPYILKFKTPDFVGASENVIISYLFKVAYGDDPMLRWALCTSDANKASYWGVTGAVEDPYQVTSGTATHVTSSAYKTQTVTVSSQLLKPNTTYFFFLWGGPATDESGYITVYELANHSVTLNWNTGVVRIFNGSTWDTYQCYVYNGSGWDLCLPYIYNGTSWDLYSG